MSQIKTITIATYAGITAFVVGVIAFVLHWNLWDIWGGPMPGIQILLFPGNLMLIYFWHPLLTEEINFWPKLALLLLGQFLVVTFVVGLLAGMVRRVSNKICGIRI